MEDDGEALRLRTLAEQKFNSSNLKSSLKYAKRAHLLNPKLDGLSEMLTALKILKFASKSAAGVGTAAADSATLPMDWYKILQTEPFSHTNTIKKQYKKLALTLHPDKNRFAGSEEAFKLVGEAFRVLSDKIRRKEYDMKLRIAMQSAVTETLEVETFWTACSTCRLLHQFERRYLGHNLRCPSCRKSFRAVEVSENVKDVEEDRVQSTSARPRARSSAHKRKISSVGEVMARSSPNAFINNMNKDFSSNNGSVIEGLRSGRAEKRRSGKNEGKPREETMTLAEMQILAKKKVTEKNMKSSLKEKERDGSSKGKDFEYKRGVVKRRGLESERPELSKCGNLDIISVEDSDFYDFDKDRVEKSFKKGQVWAIYDDVDGMPRLYGLIDEVVSVNPFELKLCWLDLQNNGDEGLIRWEKMGFHISCGRFKVSKMTSVSTLNIFSHIMDCERAARDVYRVYPKKGSVWALHNKNALDAEGRHLVTDKRLYDIVVFLTSYSEMHGLSMAYLEKVDGLKAVFKRKEIGRHAIKWLAKGDIRLFSHQIPARKLSGEEASGLSKDCWELDPASLPPELLSVGWGR